MEEKEAQEELFAERAAIREYDGGQDRATAEREARREMLECEARWVLSKPKGWRTGYLNRVEERRGKKAAGELKEEIMRQWDTTKGRG